MPDILFVERVIQILKKNGRAAIVLPDGDFENPSLEYFRKFLIENVKVEAVVSLPDGTFIPYGTGVKSSILFIKKLDKEELKKEVVATEQHEESDCYFACADASGVRRSRDAS